MKKFVTVLGATGTVGSKTLEIIRENREEFEVVGISAHSNVSLLVKFTIEFLPKYIVLSNLLLLPELEKQVSHLNVEILQGEEGLSFLASKKTDILVAAITGFAGFKPIFQAINSGIDVALANKEALVAGGHLIMPLAKEKGVRIFPVDSEHNAIFQCMMGQNWSEVDKVTLTASGGPFVSMSRNETFYVSPNKALKHPTWSMGKKISIDSATMMNKGLETIEAAWLFNIGKEKISAIIHPQSIVHGIVKFRDQSVITHMAPTDMKVPISQVLAWPKRLNIKLKEIDFTKIENLEFKEIDIVQFPCFGLAYQLIDEHPCYSIALNAANEIAVNLYLNYKLDFGNIYTLVAKTIERIEINELNDYQSIIDYDNYARNIAEFVKL